MRSRAPGTRSRTWRWVALAGTGLVIAGGAGVLGTRAGHRADDHRAVADAVEMIQLRAEIRRSHLAEVNEVMLDFLGVGRPSDLAAARAARAAARTHVADVLSRIDDDPDATGIEALWFADVLRADGIGDSAEADPDALFDTQRSAARDGRPPDEVVPDSVVQLYDLMRTDSAGEQLLNDALDAEYVRQDPEPTEIVAGYVSRSEPYIRSDGGYLGPDAEQPLVDSYVYEPTATVELPAIAQIDAIIAATPLWAYDQWIRSWQDVDDPGAPPLALRDLADLVADVDQQIRAQVDPILDDAWHDADAARRSAHQQSMAWFGLALLGGLLTLGIAGGWAAARLRRTRARSALVATDRLTGVGNRHLLDERTTALLADADLQWHLVAMIDMDRFKLINDSWGHAAGDAVLVEVADGLRSIVHEWQHGGHDRDGTVVRLGGDEFLLSLHGRTPGDVEHVRARLDALRASTIEPSPGEQLELAFSIGIATAVGRAALDDLMRIADLASYDEKAIRLSGTGGRRSSDRTDAPATEPVE